MRVEIIKFITPFTGAKVKVGDEYEVLTINEDGTYHLYDEIGHIYPPSWVKVLDKENEIKKAQDILNGKVPALSDFEYERSQNFIKSLEENND